MSSNRRCRVTDDAVVGAVVAAAVGVPGDVAAAAVAVVAAVAACVGVIGVVVVGVLGLNIVVVFVIVIVVVVVGVVVCRVVGCNLGCPKRRICHLFALTLIFVACDESTTKQRLNNNQLAANTNH
jgi:hypothetical protein